MDKDFTMTTAEKTLKWWNDYKTMNGTYPLIAEIEAQLQMAVDEEKLVKNCSIPDVVGRSEQLCQYKSCNEKHYMYGYCKHHLAQQDL